MQWFALCGSNEHWFLTKNTIDTSYSMYSTWVKGAVIFAIGPNNFSKFSMSGANEQWFSTKDTIDTFYSMHSTWVKGSVIFAIGLNIFFNFPWVGQMSSGFQLKTQWIFSTPCIVYGLNVQWFLAIGSNYLFLFSVSGSNEQWFSTKDRISIPYFMHSGWVECPVICYMCVKWAVGIN